jgi:hypothetical protein
MVHWAWLLLSGFAGFALGLFAMGLLAAGATESSYRAGFCEGLAEGHAAGFQDGIKELQRVG